VGFDPWLAPVTAFWFEGIAMSLMMIPSTTYSGSAGALIE
jgi:hypothetical protein